MAGIKCINCGYIGILENQGILFDGKTDDMPNSRCFMYKGHNSFSGRLHYKCSMCETIILVDSMDVLGAVGYEIITDVREKPKEKGFFASFFLSQEKKNGDCQIRSGADVSAK